MDIHGCVSPSSYMVPAAHWDAYTNGFFCNIVAAFFKGRPAPEKYAPAVLRIGCYKGLIRDALPDAPAQKTPNARIPTLEAAHPCRCPADFGSRQKIIFLYAHSGILPPQYPYPPLQEIHGAR